MARSIEMSFSASRPRRALRSMSIGSLLICAQVRTVQPARPALTQPALEGVGRSELDLYSPRAKFGVAELPAPAFQVEPHTVGVCPGNPSRDGLRVHGARGIGDP